LGVQVISKKTAAIKNEIRKSHKSGINLINLLLRKIDRDNSPPPCDLRVLMLNPMSNPERIKKTILKVPPKYCPKGLKALMP